jgi:hypothetical protein
MEGTDAARSKWPLPRKSDYDATALENSRRRGRCCWFLARLACLPPRSRRSGVTRASAGFPGSEARGPGPTAFSGLPAGLSRTFFPVAAQVERATDRPTKLRSDFLFFPVPVLILDRLRGRGGDARARPAVRGAEGGHPGCGAERGGRGSRGEVVGKSWEVVGKTWGSPG